MGNRTYRNPWNTQLIQRERAFASNELHMQGAYLEADRAERMKPLDCGHCHQTAWYKSTIGSYKCPACGSVRITPDDWTDPTEERKANE